MFYYVRLAVYSHYIHNGLIHHLLKRYLLPTCLRTRFLYMKYNAVGMLYFSINRCLGMNKGPVMFEGKCYLRKRIFRKIFLPYSRIQLTSLC